MSVKKAVLLAVGDAGEDESFQRALGEEYSLQVIRDKDELQQQIEKENAGWHIIILDVGHYMKEIRQLSSKPWFDSVILLVLAGSSDSLLIEEAYLLGAMEVFQRPLVECVIHKRVAQVERIFARQESDKKLMLEAATDPLTNIFNRRAIEKRIKESLKMNPSGSAALCMIDIDNFKLLNDSYGHKTGDNALVVIAKKLLDVTGAEGIAGRVGGDEFIVFFMEAGDPCKVQKRMGRLNIRIFMEQKDVYMTSSVGIAFYPQDGVTYEQLFQKADKALYKAKEKGKNCCVLYEKGMERVPCRSAVSERNGTEENQV